MGLSPEQRTDRARNAVLASWDKTRDRSARTAPARIAAFQRFENQVDPDRVLPDDERRRLVQIAARDHYSEMGRRSAQVRRERRETATT